jgi:hypothetical protein
VPNPKNRDSNTDTTCGMSTGKPKKPLLHRLIGWPSLVIGAAALALSAFLQDWMLALIGGSVVVLSIAELIATASGRR